MPVNLFRLIDPPEVTVIAARIPASRPGRVGPPAVERTDTGGGWIVYHPRYRAFLRRVGVASGRAAYDLPGEVVSGHADRHVVRVELPGKACYLKREHTASRRAKWRNLFAGFGPVSRAAREAATLNALEARRLPGPQWLAHGEDARGHAFLLVEELCRSTELRALIGDDAVSVESRRRISTDIAASLADLHAAGFTTPELAAKHVYVDAADGAVTILDWQSARAGRVPSPAEVCSYLANLHASTPAGATPAERLRFLATYRRATVRTGCAFPDAHELAREIGRLAAGRSRRSSVCDQGRPTPTGQRLVWLAGEAVCVLPEVAPLWPTPATASPFYVAGEGDETVEEPVVLADGRRATLTRFHTFDPVGRVAAALRERPWRSPGALAARVLFHLDRHAIPAARLLAFGQKLRSRVVADSFVLTDAVSDRTPLSVALADPARPISARRALLDECGQFLERLHAAGLRLVPGGTGRPVLALAAGILRVESPQGVKLQRAMTDGRRGKDLVRLFACEVPGLSRGERAAVVRGYLGDRWADRATRRRYLRSTR
jgi:hypothetical protein